MLGVDLEDDPQQLLARQRLCSLKALITPPRNIVPDVYKRVIIESEDSLSVVSVVNGAPIGKNRTGLAIASANVRKTPDTTARALLFQENTAMKISNRVFLKSAFLLAWIAILSGILIFGWTPTWKALLVPTWSPAFADMRSVQGALKSARQGLNPQVDNPGDPWNRPLNYPAVWIWIAKLCGFDHEINYLIFVSIAVLCFIYCLYNLISETNSIWILLIAFSGASLFAVERGNNDIIIFSLVYLAAGAPGQLMVLLLLTATALKIFPILVFPALIAERVSALIFGICSTALMFFMRTELTAIRAGTPVYYGLSYGSACIAAAAEKFFHLKIPQILISTLLIASVFVVYLKPFRFLDLHAECTNERVKRLFCFGAYIFVGTFLLNSNWDYRLIFLLLCVPYVLLIQNQFARIFILVCMFAAANQMLLHFILRSVGPMVSLLAKCILFSTLGAMILSLLKTEIESIRLFGAPAKTAQPV